MKNEREDEAIEILKNYKFTDLQFLRGHPEGFGQINRLQEDQVSFKFEWVYSHSSFNILQSALLNKQSKLATYIIRDHKFYNQQLR